MGLAQTLFEAFAAADALAATLAHVVRDLRDASIENSQAAPGAGLTIVKALVEMQGGDVGVESASEYPTTF